MITGRLDIGRQQQRNVDLLYIARGVLPRFERPFVRHAQDA